MFLSAFGHLGVLCFFGRPPFLRKLREVIQLEDASSTQLQDCYQLTVYLVDKNPFIYIVLHTFVRQVRFN